MKQTHEKLEKLHAQSDRQAPDSLPTPKPVVFEPGQRPDRPPTVDLLKHPVKGPEVFEAPDANIQIKPETDHLGVTINTGEQWGCGILFFGPEQFRTSSGPVFTTNLDGYSTIELDASVGKKITFQLLLDEAGTDAPNVVSYDTSAGDDAESFVFPVKQGREARHLYRFELKNLQARKDWGNQKGMRKVDIYAVKGIAIYFPGGQGQDELKIYSLRLAR